MGGGQSGISHVIFIFSFTAMFWNIRYENKQTNKQKDFLCLYLLSASSLNLSVENFLVHIFPTKALHVGIPFEAIDKCECEWYALPHDLSRSIKCKYRFICAVKARMSVQSNLSWKTRKERLMSISSRPCQGFQLGIVRSTPDTWYRILPN